MQCGMCESHVNDMIRSHFKVKKVKSSHAKGETEIITEDNISKEDLKKELESMGYELKDLSSETYVKKGLFFR